MNEISVQAFEQAIRATHQCGSRHLSRASVHEIHDGKTVWQGEVLVFELSDHPEVERCYAWEVDGRVTAVLHEPPVDSPRAAVQAAIVAEHRQR